MKLSFKLVQTPAGSRIVLGGAINEDVKSLLAANESQMAPNITVDFADVSFINSCGTRDWALFIHRTSHRASFVYENCTEDVIMQINMVPEFAGNAAIKSVNRTFECESCKTKETLHLVAGTDFEMGKIPHARDVPCRSCGKATEAMEDDEEFFQFLLKSA